MRIDFKGMAETVIPHFKGGEKEIAAKMYADGVNRIMRGRLAPGASIGNHTHGTSSEILYILEGEAKAVCDGETERLAPGDCHYCPEGSSHSFVNESDADLIFLGVVPEHDLAAE